MTREEAIKTLKENYCAMCAYGSQCMESCDIRGCDNRDAIKALEQEPSEDAISLRAVHEAITRWAGSMSVLVALPTREVRPLLDSIHELPSVTPMQRTGHWIFVDKAHEHAQCSECDYGNVDLFDGRPHNYCPSCGCHMVEPQESEVQDADSD